MARSGARARRSRSARASRAPRTPRARLAAEPAPAHSRRRRGRDRRRVQRADRSRHVHDRGDRRQARPDRALRRHRGGGARGRRSSAACSAIHPVFDVPHAMGLDARVARSFCTRASVWLRRSSRCVFTDGLLIVRKRVSGPSRSPQLGAPAVGGAVTGVLAVGVMALLHTEGVTGGGYERLEASRSPASSASRSCSSCAW